MIGVGSEGTTPCLIFWVLGEHTACYSENWVISSPGFSGHHVVTTCAVFAAVVLTAWGKTLAAAAPPADHLLLSSPFQKVLEHGLLMWG